MGKGKLGRGRTHMLAAVLLVAVIASAGTLAACGSSGTTTTNAGASSAATTPMDKAKEVLGHDPTGLAKKIVDSGVVVVANDANYPPQSSVDKATGEMVGFDVDVANKMGELLGLKVEFENPAWETIPAGLQQGRFGVSIGSMTPTSERRKALAFTEPYYYVSAQVFVKKGGMQIAGAQDLAGKKVGTGAGTTYYTYLKQSTKADVKTYQTDADAFPDLANGNIDFVMTAGPTGQQAISQGQPFEFSGKPLSYDDCCFAIKRGEPDWLDMLEYAVQTMHQDGSLTAMSEKWYNGLDLTVKE